MVDNRSYAGAPSTFYRQFKRRHHMTPSDVRQMASGPNGKDS